MRFYRIWCAFERHYVNPLTGRHGRYRVKDCYPDGGSKPDCAVIHFATDHYQEIGVLATKAYKRGSIIQPHKELNRVLIAGRASA